MTIFDVMWFLIVISAVALTLAAIDGALMAVCHIRDRRRLRASFCRCGEHLAPTTTDGWAHDKGRCCPLVEVMA